MAAEYDAESSNVSSSAQATLNKVDSNKSNKTSSGSVRRNNSNTMIRHEDRTELVNIATVLSRRRSSVAVHHQSSKKSLGAVDEYDATLDPEHGDFDLERWVRHFIDQLHENGISERRTSVAFRKLEVHGSGSALQLQQTVGSMLAAPLRMGEFFSFGRKEPKQILRGFEGLLSSGELLVVLGRPGSGCSTLLKTLCGELESLELGKESRVHYNGIPQRQMQREFKGEAVYNQEVRVS